MSKNYGKSYSDYLKLKIGAHTKRNEIIDSVKEWFFENYPSINICEVYVNDRPMIDQLCLVLHERLSANVINHFCNEFQLNIHNEFYRIRREHGRTMIIGNPHVDFEEWRYSFKQK